MSLPFGSSNVGRSYQAAAGVNLKLPGLEAAAAGIGQVNRELGALKASLSDLGSSGYQLAAGVTRNLESIEKQARSTAAARGSVSAAAGGIGAGSGGGGGKPPPISGASYGAYGSPD